MTTLRYDELFITFGDEKYAEIGVMLTFLRSLSFIHQTNHWQCQGKDSYSDHLLFARLYESTSGHVDSCAERAVGLGNKNLVDIRHSLTNMSKIIGSIENRPLPDEDQGVYKSLLAEKTFVAIGEKIMDDLKSKKLLTRGLEQLLGDILSDHEDLVYLLKQRLAR